MTRKTRLQRLRSKIKNKADCPDCGGTGRIRKGKYGACARCFVTSRIVAVHPTDLAWLIDLAGKSLQ
jgi:hypothetical protein